MNETIFYFFYNLLSHQSIFLNGVIIFFAEILPEILIIAIGFFYYVISDSENDFRVFIRKYSKELVSAFFPGLLAWILSVGLKILIHTERPFEILKNVSPLFPETGFAFPSTHAAVFSALAVSIFFFHKKAGYVFMFFAFVIGLSRVIAGVHFPVDILGGFALGAFIAYFLKNV